MFLKMTQFQSFLWLIFHCIYVPHLLYSLLCWWHLGCFHILTIINSATFGGHASFWSITTNKASGGDGIPVELFQIIKDDAVKVLHLICQKIWKTQQWPQDWKRSVFIPIPKKGNAKECSTYCTFALISHAAAATAKSFHSCRILCDPIDGSPSGSPVPGILQAITLEWVAISFSNAWKWKVKVKSLSRVRLLATSGTAAHQAPPSPGLSRQEHGSGLPFPSPMCESEVTQSCPTLSDPVDCSLPGSSVHRIFQARVLEWGAIAFSNCW